MVGPQAPPCVSRRATGAFDHAMQSTLVGMSARIRVRAHAARVALGAFEDLGFMGVEIAIHRVRTQAHLPGESQDRVDLHLLQEGNARPLGRSVCHTLTIRRRNSIADYEFRCTPLNPPITPELQVSFLNGVFYSSLVCKSLLPVTRL
jgi:hypothetical protein